MPSIVVNGGRLPALAVVGSLANASISHVAILQETASPNHGQKAKVWHTGPPTKLGECEIHLAGCIDDLTPGEQATLIHEAEDTVSNMPKIAKPKNVAKHHRRDEMKRQLLSHYSILPPIREVRDNTTNVLRHRRFSCAGFVVHCYEEGIDVQLVNQEKLPLIGWAEIQRVYATQLANLTEPEIEELGLSKQRVTVNAGLGWRQTYTENVDSWPILMPSYLLDSVARSSVDIRSTSFQP